eukprot:2561237-Prymnesium_polylepis.3
MGSSHEQPASVSRPHPEPVSGREGVCAEGWDLVTSHRGMCLAPQPRRRLPGGRAPSASPFWALRRAKPC